MTSATLAWEWAVVEVFLPLVTQGPGDASVYMSTFVADKPRFTTMTGGKKYAINGLPIPRRPQPGIRPDDGHGGRIANARFNNVRVIHDELLDTLPNATEGHRIHGL